LEHREPLIRNISDTARWAAVYRARESERGDALFRDPFARRLAGERGKQIADTLPKGNRNTWSWVMRTWLFDQLIAEQISQGVDLVVNLAAGLDARPYRLALPPSLTWIEVDLPELLDFKEAALEGEKSSCALERIRLDLSHLEARRELFEELGRRAQKALILTGGLLIYLTRREVGSLAENLARPPSFQRWILDVVSPGLLRMIQKNWGRNLDDGGAPPKFAPLEGPPFFSRYGWDPTQVRSVFRAAARAKRLPFLLQLMAHLPESPGPQGSRPWSGICLLARR